MAICTMSRSCLQHLGRTSSSPSTARVFLHLASPRSLHATPPVLDFLLPTIPSRSLHNARLRHNIISRSQQLKRSFASSVQRQTTVLVHPRQDEDGQDMTVEITPRASNRLREIMTKDANPHLALRIQVESGGCHGFQYLMSLTTLPPLEGSSASAAPKNPSSDEPQEPSKAFPSSPFPGQKEKMAELDEDDTVFAADDGSGAKVVMDGPSLELLKGSKVDFTMELIGSQFKIVDNPLATSSCGCGTSFDIKA